MSEVVSPAGRRMTRALARALDDVTGTERVAAAAALAEGGKGRMGRVYKALAFELLLCGLREADALHALGGELVDGGDGGGPAWPAAAGGAAVLDPTTGVWSLLPDDADGGRLP